FEPKRGDGLFDPECCFRGCSRGDAQRDHIGPFEGLRRKVFKTRNAATQTRTELGPFLWIVFEREVSEEAQMPSACQIERVTLARDLPNVLLRPFKKGPAPG